MTSVNQINPKVDLSVRVFDNFYGQSIQVPTNEYDAVNSALRNIFSATETADTFTEEIFRIANINQEPALTILAQIQNQNEIELTATVAYLLNSIRSPSTLLGINAVSTPNIWAARNVRA